jgi:hypothetical protein
LLRRGLLHKGARRFTHEIRIHLLQFSFPFAIPLTMPRTFNLYGTDSDLTAVRGSAGFLCELAPDSPSVIGAEHCYWPEELLGSADEALRTSASLVLQIMRGLSTVGGLRILGTLEEPLLEQASYSVQTLRLDRWIRSQGISACHFDSYSPWLDRLRQIRKVTGCAYELTASVPFGQANWIQRGILDLRKSIGRPSELFRRIAPLWWRVLSSVPTHKSVATAPQGGIWCYSTAYNYTKIALEYDAYFPQKMNFLVEDPATAGKLLSQLGRDSYVLYAWSRASDVPSVSEVREIGKSISKAVAEVPLTGDEAVLRTVVLKSEWWDHFLKRILPLAIFHQRTLERWCDAVRPEMLVVGNAGDERALLDYEPAKRVPSVMLQHGIMHWVYCVADQPVTHFLIRGRFFQNLVNENLRKRMILCNHPQEIPASQQGSSRAGILFITMPYRVAPLFHDADLHDILSCLLRVSHRSKRPLFIRVHPAERISSYQRLVSEIQEELEFRCEVVYSQGPGGEDLLARCCVAVLYFSTMFLDCLRHSIPIVSPGWHWFPNKEHFREAKIFNFASDLRHLEELVNNGIDGRLPSRAGSLDEFLASTQPQEISRVLNDIWQSRSGGYAGDLAMRPKNVSS